MRCKSVKQGSSLRHQPSDVAYSGLIITRVTCMRRNEDCGHCLMMCEL